MNLKSIHDQFPMVSTMMNEHPLVYLDNGATTQKPLQVIKALQNFYTHHYATIHRGVYTISQEATQKVDETRKIIQNFLNAKNTHEIIFTRGTTEAINLVARSYAAQFLKPNDSILVTEMEHHANWVPWQQIAKEKGLHFKVCPFKENGELDLEAYTKLLTTDVKLVALTHVSNVLGTINPIKELVKQAHASGAKVLIDGAQAIAHMRVDVQDLNCDFYCFSSHKCYGPTGVGVLYGKESLLTSMPPYQFGGDMVLKVKVEETTFAPLPEKFEAGTPAIAEIIGLGEAIKFIQEIGFEVIHTHEVELSKFTTETLNQIPELTLVGTAPQKSAVFSFTIKGIHPHDIGTILDTEGVAIRAGHHCAQPIMAHYGIPATARASLAIYTTKEDIIALEKALHKARKLLR